jgi:hypothetical protein
MAKTISTKKLYLLTFFISVSLMIFESKELFIASLALIVSIVSAFKNQIFPFQLETLTDSIILAAPSAPSHNSLALIIPITFLNKGHGSGVIEGLTIKIECCNRIKIYTPSAEIDYKKFIQSKRRLDAENILNTSISFPLSGESSVQKYILFIQEENSQKYPFSYWEENNYTFNFYIKHSHKDFPILYSSFDKFISAQKLDDYKIGNCIVIGPNQELDI